MYITVCVLIVVQANDKKKTRDNLEQINVAKHVSEEVNTFVGSQDAAKVLGLEGVIVGTLRMEQRILVLVFLDVLHKPA